MTFSIKNPVAFVLTAMACVVLCTATASADIVTFWKTDVCPDFGGMKVAIASEVGSMQAPVNREVPLATQIDASVSGVGAPFCVLDSLPVATIDGPGQKALNVYNANIVFNSSDPLVDGDLYRCVVCQYEDKVIQAIPALSLLGTAILMGGLLTACLYELRKRRAAAAA